MPSYKKENELYTVRQEGSSYTMQPYKKENGCQEALSHTMQPYKKEIGLYTKENGCQEGSSYTMQPAQKGNGLYTKENGLWGVSFRQFLPEIAQKRDERPPAAPKKQVFKTKICRSFATTGECMFGNDCPHAHLVSGLNRVPSIFNNATPSAISSFYSKNGNYHS